MHAHPVMFKKNTLLKVFWELKKTFNPTLLKVNESFKCFYAISFQSAFGLRPFGTVGRM